MEYLLLVVISLGCLVFMTGVLFNRAGFSSWFAASALIAGAIPLFVLALMEWPVRRELGWLRVKAGTANDEDFALAQRFASALERDGRYSDAADCYELLAGKLTDPQEAAYLQDCAVRAREFAVKSSTV